MENLKKDGAPTKALVIIIVMAKKTLTLIRHPCSPLTQITSSPCLWQEDRTRTYYLIFTIKIFWFTTFCDGRNPSDCDIFGFKKFYFYHGTIKMTKPCKEERISTIKFHFKYTRQIVSTWNTWNQDIRSLDLCRLHKNTSLQISFAQWWKIFTPIAQLETQIQGWRWELEDNDMKMLKRGWTARKTSRCLDLRQRPPGRWSFHRNSLPPMPWNGREEEGSRWKKGGGKQKLKLKLKGRERCNCANVVVDERETMSNRVRCCNLLPPETNVYLSIKKC